MDKKIKELIAEELVLVAKNLLAVPYGLEKHPTGNNKETIRIRKKYRELFMVKYKELRSRRREQINTFRKREKETENMVKDLTRQEKQLSSQYKSNLNKVIQRRKQVEREYKNFDKETDKEWSALDKEFDKFSRENENAEKRELKPHKLTPKDWRDDMRLN